ncbi:kelch repeat-containing protein [uncultured Polaribacter sp.]|uniref:Kelch repeat-containing protein n=1 Tax=uncultured Polaribacter sp. TaxID=174711 RepID=UPI00261A4527|nr:kelch repeat-containing protein [uncultured Polaribacter sp.]
MKYFKYIFILFFIFSCKKSPVWQVINTENNCTARHECGFVAHKNDLYLIGGRGDKPVEGYTIKNRTWTILKSPPLEMNHITPVSLNNSIYIVSGFTGNYPDENPLQYVYKFNSQSNTWQTVFEIPEERRRGGAGVTVFKDKIYIVNGIKNGHTDGTNFMFDVYDPINNTWEVLPNSPTKRDHSNAVILDDTLIALGGRNTSYHEENNFQAFFETIINSVDYYDFNTEKWNTFKEVLPNPAAGSAAVVLNNELYYFGGETGEKETNKTMFSFNLKDKIWTQKPSLVNGRHGTNGTVLENKIYIASGSGNQGGGPELTSIEVYK